MGVEMYVEVLFVVIVEEWVEEVHWLGVSVVGG